MSLVVGVVVADWSASESRRVKSNMALLRLFVIAMLVLACPEQDSSSRWEKNMTSRTIAKGQEGKRSSESVQNVRKPLARRHF